MDTLTSTTAKPLAPSRRRWLKQAWVLFGGLVLSKLFCGWLKISGRKRHLRAPTQSGNKKSESRKAILPKPNEVTIGPDNNFHLAGLPRGGLLALSRCCTHQNGSLLWDDKTNHFICPRHQSCFDLWGEVCRGPATRPLDFYPLEMAQGQLQINPAKPHQRIRYESRQATWRL